MIAQFGLVATTFGAGSAVAEGVAFEDRSREHSTVASRENMRDYDPSKKYGAAGVSDRNWEEYQALGVSAGNYVIFPAINILNHYDDNIFSTTNNSKSGWRFEVAPSVIFSSRLPRHVLDLIVNARHVEFSHSEQEAFSDGSLYLRGRLDIDHAQAFFGHALISLEHEELGSAEADRDAREPIEYLRNRAELGYIHDAGRLALRVGVKAEEFNYADVDGFDRAKIDQDYRDTKNYSGNLKLSYRFSPGYEIDTQFRVKRTENTGNEFIDRDALSYDVLAGVKFEFSPLLHGYLAAGYEHIDFEQTGFEDLNAAVYKAQLEWLPTPLLNITLGAERYSSVTGFGDAATRLDSVFDGKLEYEIWRNLVFTATGKYTISDYVGTGREDKGLQAGAGLEYLANRNLKLTANYNYRERDSDIEEFNFQGSRYMLGLSLKY